MGRIPLLKGPLLLAIHAAATFPITKIRAIKIRVTRIHVKHAEVIVTLCRRHPQEPLEI
jgi:hypothetical protein